MCNRRGQLNMPHTLAAHLGSGYFHTTFFAHDATIFHAFVLAAQAFIIFDWAKDTRAEQTITLWLKRAVIDGFRLLHFAE